MADDLDRTAAFMTPAKLAQLKASKPVAASPAAWLDGMAADAGRAHVARLSELREQLAAQASEQGEAPLLEALDRVARALERLDFTLLQPKGWLARATGKARSAGAEFAAQYEAIVEAAAGLRERVLQLQKKVQADASACERTLVEMNVEGAAIEKLLEQGARWLQDMQVQLKERQAAAPDEAAQRQVREDAARCESLQGRLKVLRGVAVQARQALAQAHEAAASRASFVQGAQQLLAVQYKTWEGRVAPLAASAGDSGSPTLGQEGPQEAQKDLRERLEQTSAEGRQLQAQEASLARQLESLGEALQSAA